MNTTFDREDNLLLDFDTAAEEAIAFEDAEIRQAAQLSSQILNLEAQWQTYLQALAWLGFESWLRARDPEIVIDSANCSLTQPPYANFIAAVFNLVVNQFKICLLTADVMLDQSISLPRAVLDLPEYAAHFYVVVAVDEDREEAVISSFITYDELKQRQQSANLQPDSDWQYQLPLNWFNSEIDQFLLYLRCLEPNEIVLPTATTESLDATVQTELEALIPQLQAQDNNLPEILTWEQARSILINPALLDWLYELKTTASANQNVASWRNSLATIFDNLTERAINVSAWLQNELDELAQSLAWRLLPTPALATAAFRDLQAINRESPTEELAAILTQLRQTGVEIATDASSAYRDFAVGEAALRLFAIAWKDTPAEWILLIVLGAQPQYQLPSGLKMLLQEGETVLDEKIVEKAEDSYLYTLVIGTLEEQFTVKLIFPDGETISLPPFALV